MSFLASCSMRVRKLEDQNLDYRRETLTLRFTYWHQLHISPFAR
jgi:hypothetical protein